MGEHFIHDDDPIYKLLDKGLFSGIPTTGPHHERRAAIIARARANARNGEPCLFRLVVPDGATSTLTVHALAKRVKLTQDNIRRYEAGSLTRIRAETLQAFKALDRFFNLAPGTYELAVRRKIDSAKKKRRISLLS